MPTKKVFSAIAGAIANTSACCPTCKKNLTISIAYALRGLNPRFNFDTFYGACRVLQEEKLRPSRSLGSDHGEQLSLPYSAPVQPTS